MDNVKREEVWVELWHEHHQYFLKLASRFAGGDRSDADDLVQETFIRVFRFLHTFRYGCTYRSWIRRIFINVFRDRCKRRRLERTHLHFTHFEDDEFEVYALSQLFADPNSDPEQIVLHTQFSDAVQEALDALPKSWAACVILVDVQEVEYAEAALLLRKPIGTVRSQLHRGRAHMRNRLTRAGAASSHPPDTQKTA